MNWKLFASTYALIAVSELPDKTALATVLMSSRGRALPIFVGTCSAFIVQTSIAVAFGGLLAFLPEKLVHLIAGLLFLSFAYMQWREATQSADESDKTHAGEACPTGFWPAATNAFLVIFIAEWGDLTQLATATMAARSSENLITIFLASALALCSVSALAIILGRLAANLIPETAILKLSAFAFGAIGVYFLVEDFLR